LTFCTAHRRQIFKESALIDEAIDEISRAAASHQFAVIAYCFMPDHLHLLAEATSESSDLVAFAHKIKQRTAYRYRRRQDYPFSGSLVFTRQQLDELWQSIAEGSVGTVGTP